MLVHLQARLNRFLRVEFNMRSMLQQVKHYHLGCGESLCLSDSLLKRKSITLSDMKRLLVKQNTKKSKSDR